MICLVFQSILVAMQQFQMPLANAAHKASSEFLLTHAGSPTFKVSEVSTYFSFIVALCSAQNKARTYLSVVVALYSVQNVSERTTG